MGIMNVIKYNIECNKAGRKLVIPDKPAVYLNCFGKEPVHFIGSHASKLCTGCSDYKNLSHFKLKNNGLYISVLCKRCLQYDIKDTHQYHISLTKVYRNIVSKLRYVTKNKSIEYSDITDDLIEMYKKTIILKTKTKWQKQQQNQSM